MLSEILWILSAGFSLATISFVLRDLNLWSNSIGVAAERRKLRKVSMVLREIEDTLCTGNIPSDDQWIEVSSLPTPWGKLVHQSLVELRQSGAALLPTLKRMRALAEEQETALLDAKARSAQAVSQAVVCALMVPGFGTALYVLLPGVDEHPYQWLGGCALAIGLSSLGSALMLKYANAARWAGLKEELRPWIFSAQCAGERFLALIRSGTPADLSWTRAVELLQEYSPELAVRWGSSVWTEGMRTQLPSSTAAVALIDFGTSLKRAVQASLMEGRPCGDRVETALQALRQEIRAQIDRELGLLPTRALKPLFCFVAPSIFTLLIFGFWLAWGEVSSGASLAF